MFLSDAPQRARESGGLLADDLVFESELWATDPNTGLPIPPWTEAEILAGQVQLTAPDVITEAETNQAEADGQITTQEADLIKAAIAAAAQISIGIANAVMKAKGSQYTATGTGAENGGGNGITAAGIPWTPIVAVGGVLLLVGLLSRRRSRGGA